MRHRLQTAAGKKLYKLRQQTVEPVFGIVKSALGFRQFLLRGLGKAFTEWTLATSTRNLPCVLALKEKAPAGWWQRGLRE